MNLRTQNKDSLEDVVSTSLDPSKREGRVGQEACVNMGWGVYMCKGIRVGEQGVGSLLRPGLHLKIRLI